MKGGTHVRVRIAFTFKKLNGKRRIIQGMSKFCQNFSSSRIYHEGKSASIPLPHKYLANCSMYIRKVHVFNHALVMFVQNFKLDCE